MQKDHSNLVQTLPISQLVVEELVANFLTAAVGLQLCGVAESAISPLTNELAVVENFALRGYTSWNTDRGHVWARGIYDIDRSQRIHAHVVLFAWYLTEDIPHEGWWYCFPNRPNEWIKGRGPRDLA